MSEATSVLTIRTPEGAQFSLPLAGPVSRLLAFLLDLLVTLALVVALPTPSAPPWVSRPFWQATSAITTPKQSAFVSPCT